MTPRALDPKIDSHPGATSVHKPYTAASLVLWRQHGAAFGSVANVGPTNRRPNSLMQIVKGDLGDISIPAMDPAIPTRPVTMKLTTKVSNEAIIRQVTAFRD